MSIKIEEYRKKQREYRRKWRKDNFEKNRVDAKNWRNSNPEKKQQQHKRYIEKCQGETKSMASNHYKRWTKEDIKYLSINSKFKTAKNIAIDLSRTYLAVLMKAHVEDITLITKEKLVGAPRID